MKNESMPDGVPDFQSFDQFKSEKAFEYIKNRPEIKAKMEEIQDLDKKSKEKKKIFEEEIDALMISSEEIRKRAREEVEKKERKRKSSLTLGIELLSLCLKNSAEIYASEMSDDKKKQFEKLWLLLKFITADLKNPSADQMVIDDAIVRMESVQNSLREDFGIVDQTLSKALSIVKDLKRRINGEIFHDWETLLVDPLSINHSDILIHPDKFFSKNSIQMNPESVSLDYDKSEFFVPDLAQLEGKKLCEVIDYVTQVYGLDYIIPGVECSTWFEKPSYESEYQPHEKKLRKIFEKEIRRRSDNCPNYPTYFLTFYFPGSLIVEIPSSSYKKDYEVDIPAVNVGGGGQRMGSSLDTEWKNDLCAIVLVKKTKDDSI